MTHGGWTDSQGCRRGGGRGGGWGSGRGNGRNAATRRCCKPLLGRSRHATISTTWGIGREGVQGDIERKDGRERATNGNTNENVSLLQLIQRRKQRLWATLLKYEAQFSFIDHLLHSTPKHLPLRVDPDRDEPIDLLIPVIYPATIPIPCVPILPPPSARPVSVLLFGRWSRGEHRWKEIRIRRKDIDGKVLLRPFPTKRRRGVLLSSHYQLQHDGPLPFVAERQRRGRDSDAQCRTHLPSLGKFGSPRAPRTQERRRTTSRSVGLPRCGYGRARRQRRSWGELDATDHRERELAVCEGELRWRGRNERRHPRGVLLGLRASS